MGEEKPNWYEEEKEMPQPLAWVVITLFSAFIVGYGVVTYLLVDDGPRQWSYGTLADTPAESIYNSAVPGKPAQAPPQITPLPEPGAGKP
jgi:hypothetical protein